MSERGPNGEGEPRPKPKEFYTVRPVEVEVTRKGVRTTFEVVTGSYTPEGAEELAKQAFKDIDEVTGGKGREIKRSGEKSFGFSSWAGSTWQPEGTLNKRHAPGSSRPELN